jgi:tRNA-dihydrouridine synthase B
VQDTVTCPVLMKLRIGMEHKSECLDKFWEIVTRAVEQGVDALVIHGRAVSDKFRSKADWDILAEVKRRFPATTIVGSGDVFDPPATVDLMRRTGLDGFVVARGAVGNPWIFRELRCVWEGRPVPPPPDLAEQRLVMLTHLDWTLQGYSEQLGVGHFRKFAVGYARHHPKRKQAVLTLLQAKTRVQVEAAINRWYNDASAG